MSKKLLPRDQLKPTVHQAVPVRVPDLVVGEKSTCVPTSDPPKGCPERTPLLFRTRETFLAREGLLWLVMRRTLGGTPLPASLSPAR